MTDKWSILIQARRVIPSSQVAVEYSITPLGRTLEAPFQALFVWTVNHADAVTRAQAAFDAQPEMHPGLTVTQAPVQSRSQS